VPPVRAEARLRRLLALIPWVAARDGPSIEEVCVRFACTKAELLADLDLLFLCGLHPYTPDMLMDVDIAEGRVWIRYAEYFARPLRLTPAEGLALVAAGRTVLAAPGAEPEGPLARGLAKLAAALGIDVAGGVDVELGAASESVLAALREGAGDRRQVEIDYYSYGRDERSRRVIDPYAVFAADGEWYASGWCHRARDERLFRLDRVREAVVLDATFDPPGQEPELRVFRPQPDDQRLVLELDADARWVVEQYPVESVIEGADGTVTARLVVSGPAWLERLLLRLGPSARVIEGDTSAAASAACRMLQRYRAADTLQ
jgi:proteasome accessory factor C